MLNIWENTMTFIVLQKYINTPNLFRGSTLSFYHVKFLNPAKLYTLDLLFDNDTHTLISFLCLGLL